MKEKPVVGQKFCLVERGYRGQVQEVLDVEVTKVGRKYFTVENLGGGYKLKAEFVIETRKEWRGKNPIGESRVKLYDTVQEYEDERDRKRLYDKIGASFRGLKNPYTLEQLREAAQALGLSLEEG